MVVDVKHAVEGDNGCSYTTRLIISGWYLLVYRIQYPFWHILFTVSANLILSSELSLRNGDWSGVARSHSGKQATCSAETQ